MAECSDDLIKILDHYIELVGKLKERCQAKLSVAGVAKLLKKCTEEELFLQKLSRQKQVKQCHLKSSNLTSLGGRVDALESLPHVSTVMKTFSCPQLQNSLCVDVVCHHGYTWAKVVARKPEALHLIWAGDGQFGGRSIVDQAQEYLLCAQHNPHNFTAPSVVFIFTCGITAPLRSALEALGVHVQGSHVDVDPDTENLLRKPVEELEETISTSCTLVDQECADECGEQEEATNLHTNTQRASDTTTLDDASKPCDTTNLFDSNINFNEHPGIKNVNLDITALISLVTNLCHGGCHFTFKEHILTEQALEERKQPLLPLINDFLQGKSIHACETAVSDFRTILKTIGGPKELLRAEKLLSQIIIVKDDLSPRTKTLKNSAKIKNRAKIIFGTGDKLKAITVTANVGFVRASKNQGVHYAVFCHSPRALTEQKEVTATANVI